MIIFLSFPVRFTFYDRCTNCLISLFHYYHKNVLLVLFCWWSSCYPVLILHYYNTLVLDQFNNSYYLFLNECLDRFITFPLWSFLRKTTSVISICCCGSPDFVAPSLFFKWLLEFLEVKVLMLQMTFLVFLWEFDCLLGVPFWNLQFF